MVHVHQCSVERLIAELHAVRVQTLHELVQQGGLLPVDVRPLMPASRPSFEVLEVRAWLSRPYSTLRKSLTDSKRATCIG